jgi:hypothetical protein
LGEIVKGIIDKQEADMKLLELGNEEVKEGEDGGSEVENEDSQDEDIE